jgi:hypothetical protein
MSAAPKSKPLRRDKARLTRDATCSEDDAEQALKEIVAAQRRDNSARVLREKRTKKSSTNSD